jgi:hypothetical protein
MCIGDYISKVQLDIAGDQFLLRKQKYLFFTQVFLNINTTERVKLLIYYESYEKVYIYID